MHTDCDFIGFEDGDGEYCVCIGKHIEGGCEVVYCPGPSFCPYTDAFRPIEEDGVG